MKRFEGQIAIVTGAARGIGKAIATRLAKDGAHVVIVDILKDVAEATVKELTEAGMSVSYKIADVRPVENINKLIDEIEAEFNRIDILVNCAGVNKVVQAVDLKPEDFDFVMDINLRSPLYLAIACAKVMKKRKYGRIINLSSENSRNANVGRTAYCISKRAVNGMTGVLAAEWGIDGITVNAVAPGWVMTDMPMAAVKTGLLVQEDVLSITPMQRFGTVDEVADAVAFLASDDARFITGHVLFVDGGISTGMMPNALDYFKLQQK